MVHPIGCFRQWCIIGGGYIPHMVHELDRSILWIVTHEVVTHEIATHEVAVHELVARTPAPICRRAADQDRRFPGSERPPVYRPQVEQLTPTRRCMGRRSTRLSRRT